MPRPKSDAPSYCLHKRSGRAYVTLNGQQHTLPGEYESDESRSAYDRLVAEWLSNGRLLRTKDSRLSPTVSTILAPFFAHVDTYYVRPDGTQTSEVDNFRQALRPLRKLYGATPAAEFGPLALKSVRDEMIRLGWCRTNINKQIDRVRQVFKSAAAQQFILASVYHALQVVDGLRAGRSPAVESEPVEPVGDEVVDATVPFMPPAIAAMVKLRRLSGARGGELFIMRTCDIDMTAKVWRYCPAHKTKHHGQVRTIYFGPRAQAVLRPFLKADMQTFIFTPEEAAAWRNARQRERRKTPVTPSQQARPAKQKNRKHPFRSRYNKDSYARAITRACDRADTWTKGGIAIGNDERTVPRWHPHQLRHTSGTEIRKEADFEAAKIILGHKTDSMTQHYAERDARKAEEVIGVAHDEAEQRLAAAGI